MKQCDFLWICARGKVLEKELEGNWLQPQLGWGIEMFDGVELVAHCSGQGFRGFGRDRFGILGYNKGALAQMNLENSISSGFQMRAVEIHLNPSEGLKRGKLPTFVGNTSEGRNSPKSL